MAENLQIQECQLHHSQKELRLHSTKYWVKGLNICLCDFSFLFYKRAKLSQNKHFRPATLQIVKNEGVWVILKRDDISRQDKKLSHNISIKELSLSLLQLVIIHIQTGTKVTAFFVKIMQNTGSGRFHGREYIIRPFSEAAWYIKTIKK